MRLTISAAAALATLGACAPAPPYAGAVGNGAGYQNYALYESERTARDNALQGGAVLSRPVISGAELSAAGLPVAGADPFTAGGDPYAAAAPFGPTDPLIRPVVPVATVPLGGGAVAPNTSGISDEQDFAAVSSRESIESDRARLAAQAQAYQVIAPTELPQRPATGPNIVSYALSTTNAVGQPIYSRSGFNAAARAARACARYPSPDLAQEDFLANGGPETDRRTLDPDGDGFACSWDPAPFRTVRN